MELKNVYEKLKAQVISAGVLTSSGDVKYRINPDGTISVDHASSTGAPLSKQEIS